MHVVCLEVVSICILCVLDTNRLGPSDAAEDQEGGAAGEHVQPMIRV